MCDFRVNEGCRDGICITDGLAQGVDAVEHTH